MVAREIAEAFAVQKNCTAVCSCGIHLDGIGPETIEDILKACRELKEVILASG